MQNAIHEERMKWMTAKEVMVTTTLSRASIDRHVKAGTFPRPVKITARRNIWPRHIVERWMREREEG